MALLIALALAACGKHPPALPSAAAARVELRIRNSTEYYSVRGETASAIFEYFEKNSPTDDKGHRAGGLTSSSWNLAFNGTDGPAGCSPYSITIALNLVITLPRHDHPASLSEDIRTRWQRLVARVAAHEQRHVDIYLDGVKTMKTRMEALRRPRSCSELQKEIADIWTSQKAETDRAQDRFDDEDAARTEVDRKPLRARIDINRARLATVESELRDHEQIVDDLEQQLETTHTRIGTVTVEMGKSDTAPSNCPRARPGDRAWTLCQQYSDLVAAYHALVGPYNGAVARRKALVSEYDQIIAVITGLLEAYNWSW
ncbi:MAG TPA: DUF922 domain-containing protein [Candidatus Binatia bacterium]|nr:DUF922 domain-containing protein [Candidatus Binatia bacterium]